MQLPKTLMSVALILACIGALNWGIVAATKLAKKEEGAEGFDLVEFVGDKTHQHVATAIYLLVGLSGAVILGDKAMKAMKM
jgi:uncharacterized membrane protein YuzA (DUF378 family)